MLPESREDLWNEENGRVWPEEAERRSTAWGAVRHRRSPEGLHYGRHG